MKNKVAKTPKDLDRIVDKILAFRPPKSVKPLKRKPKIDLKRAAD